MYSIIYGESRNVYNTIQNRLRAPLEGFFFVSRLPSTASENPGTVIVLDESERPLTLRSEGWKHFGG
jgi:hypothetical protein